MPYQQHSTFPVIIDTGATITISPNHDHFDPGYTPTVGDVLQGLAAGLQIESTGTIQWALHLDDGSELVLSLPACHVLSACQCLLNMQHFFQHSKDLQHFVI